MDIKKYTEDFVDYLKDESNLSANKVREIFFPKNAEELSQYFKNNQDCNFSVSGARTGVVGGAVPVSAENESTNLISLTKLNKILGTSEENEKIYLSVEPGVTLAEVESYLNESKPQYFFPVDPTEKSASFGGIASTNASGSRSYYYSSVRNWVEELEVVLVNGTILKLKRGRDKLDGLQFEIEGTTYTFQDIEKPETKNSIGYFCQPNCDIVDIFIGAEGTLGVIVKLKIRLEKKTKKIMSFLQFFQNAEDALSFVVKVRDNLPNECLSLEFFDKNAVAIGLESNDPITKQIEAFYLDSKQFVVLSEYFYNDDDESLVDLLTKIESIVVESNADFLDSISGFQDSEIEVIKKFRHSVPEGVNRKIAKRKLEIPEIRKIATDMSVPDKYLVDVYNLYNSILTKNNFEFSIVGHAGCNHFHVNLLPRSKDEMAAALAIYETFAEEVVKMNGSVAAEHGIGRIKKKFLSYQYSKIDLEKMSLIKLAFDPKCQLNKGVILDLN